MAVLRVYILIKRYLWLYTQTKPLILRGKAGGLHYQVEVQQKETQIQRKRHWRKKICDISN